VPEQECPGSSVEVDACFRSSLRVAQRLARDRAA
jgi:hypothetical protein